MCRAVTSSTSRLLNLSWTTTEKRRQSNVVMMMLTATCTSNNHIFPTSTIHVQHSFPKASMSTSSSSSKENSSSNKGNDTITDRPFKILGIQQVAIGHDDRMTLNHLWYNIFGLQLIKQNIIIESENVCEDIVRDGNDIEIDLMTPLDSTKSPKVHIPPLNHIGLWVDDLVIAVEWMTKHGVRFTPGGIRTGAAGYNVTFIHPKSNDIFPISGNGILIELVQAPDHIIEKLRPKI
jgi:lactoylglutathione lyase